MHLDPETKTCAGAVAGAGDVNRTLAGLWRACSVDSASLVQLVRTTWRMINIITSALAPKAAANCPMLVLHKPQHHIDCVHTHRDMFVYVPYVSTTGTKHLAWKGGNKILVKSSSIDKRQTVHTFYWHFTESPLAPRQFPTSSTVSYPTPSCLCLLLLSLLALLSFARMRSSVNIKRLLWLSSNGQQGDKGESRRMRAGVWGQGSSR